jgi:hypothetical protein
MSLDVNDDALNAANYVMFVRDKELVADLRTLNGDGKGTSFDVF